MVNEQNVTFRKQMEARLATVYNQAINLPTSSNRRRKRAATVHNATIQIVPNVTRSYSGNPKNTELIYFLVENNAYPNITSAERTVALMNQVVSQMSLQYVALTLGYVVIIAAEPYVKIKAVAQLDNSSNLWIIGAVFGALFGLFLIVWCVLFIYIKFTRPPKRYKTSAHKVAALGNKNIDGDGAAVQTLAASQMEPVSVQLTNDFFECELTDKKRSTEVGTLTSACMYGELVKVENPQEHYANVKKKQKAVQTDSAGDVLPARKKRRKQKMVTPKIVDPKLNEANGNEMSSEISSQPDNYSQTVLLSSELVSVTTDENFSTIDVPIHTPIHPQPIHIPIHQEPISGRTGVIPPWNPYLAADIAREILDNFYQDRLHGLSEAKVGSEKLHENSVQKSPDILWTSDAQSKSNSEHRTMEALRRAGLIPPDDYTRLVLDTKTFSPVVNALLCNTKSDFPTQSSGFCQSDMKLDLELDTHKDLEFETCNPCDLKVNFDHKNNDHHFSPKSAW